MPAPAPRSVNPPGCGFPTDKSVGARWFPVRDALPYLRIDARLVERHRAHIEATHGKSLSMTTRHQCRVAASHLARNKPTDRAIWASVILGSHFDTSVSSRTNAALH
jgi:hypothetical protein